MSVPIVAPDAMSPVWLTRVLRGSGAISHASVVDIECERVDTGLVGQCLRYSLTYDRDEPGASSSVAGKFLSSEPVSRATGISGGTYEREVLFYREVAPVVRIRTPRTMGA